MEPGIIPKLVPKNNFRHAQLVEENKKRRCLCSLLLIEVTPGLPSVPFGFMISDRMVNELSSVVGELGGQAAIGRAVHSDEDMSAAIRAGFPHSAVEGLLKSSGLSLQQIASSLDLSLRSLQRRKSQGRLARYESDRLYRLARLVALAEYFLGDHQLAIDWLKRPNHVLGGVTPLSVVDTELGARQVENILGRIGYGGVT